MVLDKLYCDLDTVLHENVEGTINTNIRMVYLVRTIALAAVTV